MPGTIEIFVGDINDVEAHVFARYVSAEADGVQSGQDTPISLRGTLRGPYCTQAQTLPAEFKFRDLGRQPTGLAEAIIPDPCLWSPDLPQLYQVDVTAFRGDELIARYDGEIGLKRASPRRSGIEFPG